MEVWVGGGFKSYIKLLIYKPTTIMVNYGTKCQKQYSCPHSIHPVCCATYLVLIYSGATRMKHFTSSILCKTSFFNHKTQQQTWIDKLLSPPNQAQWWRAGKNFTCTPLVLNQGPLFKNQEPKNKESKNKAKKPWEIQEEWAKTKS
jgi:hypothetical protein